MRNNKYIQDFQYVAAYQENREDFIIDNDDRNDNNTAQSDLVRIALNVGFLTEKEVQELTFNVDGIMKLKEKESGCNTVINF